MNTPAVRRGRGRRALAALALGTGAAVALLLAGSASSAQASAPTTVVRPVTGAVVSTVLHTGVPAAAVIRAGSGVNGSPHGPYTLTADGCAGCHAAHTSRSPMLLNSSGPQSALCFTCHSDTGLGSATNASADFAGVPANNPTTDSYYSHTASYLDTAGTVRPKLHVLATTNEFGGVSNRHSDCSDCHNPHSASQATGAETSTGWSPSGATQGASGVTVTNGAAGTQPTYTFLNGTSTNKLTAEYQLCFKCHSGFTQLLTNTSGKPSQDVLDVGVEFNPNNTAFHPVEGAGRNTSPKMALSLAGTWNGKAGWTLTTSSTVRCTQCHASPGQLSSSTVATDTLAPHASVNRGILVRNYRDRLLKTTGENFSATDFALCFLCHNPSAFADPTTGPDMATNFAGQVTGRGFLNLHQWHSTGISGAGDNAGIGTTLDTVDAGDGNALCAECHFRTHSTATTPDQNWRLVSFSPNVTGLNGVGSPVFTRPVDASGNDTGAATCTLRCHGVNHNNVIYTGTP